MQYPLKHVTVHPMGEIIVIEIIYIHWLHILDQDSCYLASYVANKGSLNHIDPPHGCVSWITLHGRDIIVIEFSYVHGLPVLDQGSCYLASHVANKGYLNHIDH